MVTYAIDFETYYSKTYSIRDLGNWAYTHHPEFNAYMLSVAGDDGYEFCGDPKDFDWTKLNGATVIAHNAGFEMAVLIRLIELGIIQCDLEFADFFDTADLAAYLGNPRSLAEAAKALLGIVPDKSVRDKAKGKQWSDMTVKEQEEMSTYGLGDARLELQIWLEYGHLWPEWERELSAMTRDMCAEGLPIDLKAVREAVALLQTQLAACRARIPWAVDESTPALSKKFMAAECAKHGVTPPKSMAKTSEEFDEWLRQHGDSLPFAKAMGQYRSMNMLLKKLQTMEIRTEINPEDADRGQMPYSLKYGGAHTLRDSGDAGWNPQNLNRKPVLFGPDGIITDENTIKSIVIAVKTTGSLPKNTDSVDMRSMITAPPGKILGVIDLSAIEPCVLNWFAEDEEFLALLRQGMDPYEAQARVTGRWTAEGTLESGDKDLRQYMKVEVLGLGFGAGGDKAVVIAKTLAGLVITPEQGLKLVTDFRARPFIPRFWRKLEGEMAKAAPGDYHMQLPSGRIQRYREVRHFGSLSAIIPRNGRFMRIKTWGGSLTENKVQGCARDVFMDKCIQLKNEGLPQILRVHDEAVFLWDEDKAEANLKLANEVMVSPLSWAPGLPLRAAGHLCKKYTKS